jgi:hypothetical protein
MTDEVPFFPQTEATRQSIDLLNSTGAKKVTERFLQVLQRLTGAADEQVDDSTTATKNKATPADAIVEYIARQLCFMAVSTEEAALGYLRSSVRVQDRGETALTEDLAQALSAAWLEKGKQVVQAQRKDAIRSYCSPFSWSATHQDAPPLLGVRAAVVLGSGTVHEDESAEEGLQYVSDSAHHQTRLLVTFPSAAGLPEAHFSSLSKDDAYKLFLEIDAIQHALDDLEGVGQ